MLASGLPDQVGDDEDLARFLISSRHFRGGVVKPAAFLPNPKDRETSVSRQGAEPAESLWTLGRAAAGARTLYGAALLKARAVRALGLRVAAAEPPPRHAVITGWSWVENDRVLQKARQTEIAQQLASAAGEPLLR
jgi:hypothetical protein